jgi:hypothetical protein
MIGKGEAMGGGASGARSEATDGGRAVHRRRYRRFTAVGAVIFLFGFAITPAWLIGAWVGGQKLSGMEFPLSHVADVAVDSHGRIYVAESFFQRIQRYSPEGRFERGWFVPTSGVFALRTTADDRVKVATARASKLLTYSPDGQLLDAIEWGKYNYYAEYEGELETTGRMVIRGRLMPRIEYSGTGRVVIATPWAKRLISPLFPAEAYCLVGVVMLALGEWHRRRGKIDPPGA